MSKPKQWCLAIAVGAIFGALMLLAGTIFSKELFWEIAAIFILGIAILTGLIVGLDKKIPKGLHLLGFNAIGISCAFMSIKFFGGIIVGIAFGLFFALGFGMGTIFKILNSQQVQEQKGG